MKNLSAEEKNILKVILHQDPEMSIRIENMPGKTGDINAIATLIELQLNSYGMRTVYDVQEKVVYILPITDN